MCVNRAGSVPPVSADLRTTATITTTAANALSIASTGATSTFFYGIIFSSGSGANAINLAVGNSPSPSFVSLKNCALQLGGTTGGNIIFGASTVGVSTQVSLDNTTMQFASTSAGIFVRLCELTWRNTANAITGATLPTTLVQNSSAAGTVILLEGIDLSALGAGKTLVAVIAAPANYIFKDCKLGASVTIAATPTAPGGGRSSLIRCDSGDTNYRTEKYRYEGTQTVETTIVRSGGASDGTTPISWKIITTANSKRHLPFEALPISIWNETVGSPITLTIEGIWGGGAVPTNADVWMDVEYLGTSGFPIGSFATSGPADQLAAGTNLSAGSGTWGGSTTKFKLEKTVTPQEKGPLTVYVKAALASSVLFIDPKITVT